MKKVLSGYEIMSSSTSTSGSNRRRDPLLGNGFGRGASAAAEGGEIFLRNGSSREGLSTSSLRFGMGEATSAPAPAAGGGGGGGGIFDFNYERQFQDFSSSSSKLRSSASEGYHHHHHHRSSSEIVPKYESRYYDQDPKILEQMKDPFRSNNYPYDNHHQPILDPQPSSSSSHYRQTEFPEERQQPQQQPYNYDSRKYGSGSCREREQSNGCYDFYEESRRREAASPPPPFRGLLTPDFDDDPRKELLGPLGRDQQLASLGRGGQPASLGRGHHQMERLSSSPFNDHHPKKQREDEDDKMRYYDERSKPFLMPRSHDHRRPQQDSSNYEKPPLYENKPSLPSKQALPQAFSKANIRPLMSLPMPAPTELKKGPTFKNMKNRRGHNNRKVASTSPRRKKNSPPQRMDLSSPPQPQSSGRDSPPPAKSARRGPGPPQPSKSKRDSKEIQKKDSPTRKEAPKKSPSTSIRPDNTEAEQPPPPDKNEDNEDDERRKKLSAAAAAESRNNRVSALQRLGPKLSITERLGANNKTTATASTTAATASLKEQNVDLINGRTNNNKEDMKITIKCDEKSEDSSRLVMDVDSAEESLKINLKCRRCDADCLTVNEYVAHLSQDAHKKAMHLLKKRLHVTLQRMRQKQRTQQKEFEKSMENNKDGRIVDENGKKIPPIYCKICKLVFHHKRSEHNESENHKLIYKFLKPRCFICGVQFYSPMPYESHVVTLKHLQTKVRLNVEEDDDLQKRVEEMDEDNKDVEVNMDDFLTLDEVGDFDEDEIDNHEPKKEVVEEEEEEKKTKKEEKIKKEEEVKTEEKEENNEKKPQIDPEITLGEEFVKRVDMYFCDLCHKFLPRPPTTESTKAANELIEVHCKSAFHQNAYLKKMAEIEEEKKRKKEKEEKEAEAEVKFTTREEEENFNEDQLDYEPADSVTSGT